jgi:tryptophanyl-tRNA synthetase
MTSSPLVRAFSGVQPTGRLHLGNYLGAIKPWVEHQHARENLFCVVDLHALTVPEAIKPDELKARSRNVAAAFLASGIDPKVSSLFIQSHVREHTELAWVLNCVTPLGWLERMTQFKSKSEGRETVGTGLLDYPVLMAADILLYDSQVVPVGEDQKQHIELARDVAVRFNHMFGDTLVVPQPSIPLAGARVMGFDEPTVKMSKSIAETRPHHAVHLDDTPEKIRKSIMKSVTDAGCDYDPTTASPGVVNLMHVLSAVSGESIASISTRYTGKGYGYLKQEVAEAVTAELAPVQDKYRRLIDEPGYLDQVLAQSTAKVRTLAEATMTRVRHAVGIG